jgi:TonB family protein
MKSTLYLSGSIDINRSNTLLMKVTLLTISLVCLFFSSKAQKEQEAYYLKFDETEVADKDSADFIRVIQEPDSDSKFFNLIEYYTTGEKKRLGKISSTSFPLFFQGDVLSFYKNGKRASSVHYLDNNLTGSATYYFRNGVLKKEVEYFNVTPSEVEDNRMVNLWQELAYEGDSTVNYQADSVGNKLVVNGNGYVLEADPDLKGWTKAGNYKNGKIDGIWLGKDSTGICGYKEEFLLGKFIHGETWIEGARVAYSSVEEQVNGGNNVLLSYLRKTVIYPPDAQQNLITGKVLVSLIIQVDGSMTDLKIERKLYPSIDKEALRVLRKFLYWTPAKKHGVPITKKLTLPISFSLSY